MYYVSVKALYTVGYSTSLVSLTIAMVILCRFRSDPGPQRVSHRFNFIGKTLFTDKPTMKCELFQSYHRCSERFSDLHLRAGHAVAQSRMNPQT